MPGAVQDPGSSNRNFLLEMQALRFVYRLSLSSVPGCDWEQSMANNKGWQNKIGRPPKDPQEEGKIDQNIPNPIGWGSFNIHPHPHSTCLNALVICQQVTVSHPLHNGAL